jgi:DNA-binding transcriptional LysR family regulator
MVAAEVMVGSMAAGPRPEQERPPPQRRRAVTSRAIALRVIPAPAGTTAIPATTRADRDACTAAGFSPEFSVASQDHAPAQGFVGGGMGIGLMPLMGLWNRHPDVVPRKVRKPEPIRVICAATRDTAPSQPALQVLVDAVREAATG